MNHYTRTKTRASKPPPPPSEHFHPSYHHPVVNYLCHLSFPLQRLRRRVLFHQSAKTQHHRARLPDSPRSTGLGRLRHTCKWYLPNCAEKWSKYNTSSGFLVVEGCALAAISDYTSTSSLQFDGGGRSCTCRVDGYRPHHGRPSPCRRTISTCVDSA